MGETAQHGTCQCICGGQCTQREQALGWTGLCRDCWEAAVRTDYRHGIVGERYWIDGHASVANEEVPHGR